MLWIEQQPTVDICTVFCLIDCLCYYMFNQSNQFIYLNNKRIMEPTIYYTTYLVYSVLYIYWIQYFELWLRAVFIK